MEMVAEAKTLIVHMVCDKCGKGVMVPHGNVVLTTSPLQYPHKCECCSHEENYNVKYPYHKLVPIEALRKESEVNNEQNI